MPAFADHYPSNAGLKAGDTDHLGIDLARSGCGAIHPVQDIAAVQPELGDLDGDWLTFPQTIFSRKAIQQLLVVHLTRRQLPQADNRLPDGHPRKGEGSSVQVEPADRSRHLRHVQKGIVDRVEDQDPAHL